MVDLTEVGVKYDSTGLRAMGADLDAVDAKNKQVALSAKEMAASNDAVTASMGRMATAMADRTNQNPDELLGKLRPVQEVLKGLTVENGRVVAAVKDVTDAHGKLGEEAQKTGGFLSFLRNLLPGYGSDHQTAAGHVTEHAHAHSAFAHASTEVRHAIHALHPVLATAGVGMGELGAFATVARGGIGALGAAVAGTFVAELLKTGEEVRKLKEEFTATFGTIGPEMFKQTEEAAQKLGTQVQNLVPAMVQGYQSLQKARFEAQQEMRKSLEASGTLSFAPGQAGMDQMWKMAQQNGYQFDATSKTGKDLQGLIDLYKALGMSEDAAGRKAADFFLAMPKNAEQSRSAIRDATLDLTKLFEIGGKGGDEAAKATQGLFSQLKKGGLTSEGFDKIVEDSAKVGQQIAEAFGFKGPEAVGKFSAALEEAKSVSLSDFVVALNQAHMKIDEMQVPPGVAKSWSDLKTEFKHAFDVMAEAMDEGSDKGSGFSGVLDKVTAAIKKLEPTLASAVEGGIKQFNAEVKDLQKWGEDLSHFFENLQKKIDDFNKSLPSWMRSSENGAGASMPSLPTPWWIDALKNVFTGMGNGPQGTPTEGHGEHATEQVGHFDKSVKDTGESADHSKESVYQFQTGVATVGAKSIDATSQLNSFAASIQNVQSAAGSGGGSGGASGQLTPSGNAGSVQIDNGSTDNGVPVTDNNTADVGKNAGGGVYMIGPSGGANTVNNNASGTDTIALRGSVSPGEIVAVIPSAQANSSTMGALQNMIGGTPVSIGGGSVSGGVAPAAAAPAVNPTTAADQAAAGLISSLPVSPFVTALSGYMQAFSPSIIGMATTLMNQLHNLTIPFTSLGGGVFANLSGLGGFGGGAGASSYVNSIFGGGVRSGGTTFPKDSEFDPNRHPSSDSGSGGRGSNGPHLDAQTMADAQGASQESRGAAKGTDQPTVFRVNAQGQTVPFNQAGSNLLPPPPPDVSAQASAAAQNIIASQTNNTADNTAATDLTQYYGDPFSGGGSDPYTTTASATDYAPSNQSPFEDSSYVDTAFNPSSYGAPDMSGTMAGAADAGAQMDFVDIGQNATGGVYTIGGSGTTTKSSGATGTDSLALSGTVSPGEIVAVIPPDKANQATMDQLQTMVNTSPVSIGGGNVTGVGLNESELAAAVAGPAGPTPAGLDPTIRALMAQLAVIASPAFQAAAGLLGQRPQQQQAGGGSSGGGGGGSGGDKNKPQQQDQQDQPAAGAAQASRGASKGGSGADVIKVTGSGSGSGRGNAGLGKADDLSQYYGDPFSGGGWQFGQDTPVPEDLTQFYGDPFGGGAQPDQTPDLSQYYGDPFSGGATNDAYSAFDAQGTPDMNFGSSAPSAVDQGTSDFSSALAAQGDTPTVDIGDNATGGVYTVGGPGPGSSGDTIKLVGNVSPGEVVAVIPGNNATSKTKQKLSALVSGGGGGPQGLGVTSAELQSLLNRIMSLYAVSKIQAPSQQPQASGGGGGGGSKGSGDKKPQQQQDDQSGAPQASRGAGGGGRGGGNTRTLNGNQPLNSYQQQVGAAANNLYGPNGSLTNSNFDYLNQFPYQPTDSNQFDPFAGTYGDMNWDWNQSNFYDPYSAYNPTTSQELGLDNPYFNPYGVGPNAGDPGAYNAAPFDTSNLGGDYTSSAYQYPNYDTSNIYNDVNSSFGYIDSGSSGGTSSPTDFSAPYNTSSAPPPDNFSGGDFSGGDVSAATGGTFEVQNTDGGGTDSVGVNMHVNAGELVSVYSQDQLRAMSGGGDPLGTMPFPARGNKFATGGSGTVINGQLVSSPQVIPAAGYYSQAEKAGGAYAAELQSGNFQILNGQVVQNPVAMLQSMQAPTSPYFIGPASAKGPKGFAPSYEMLNPGPTGPTTPLALPGGGQPQSLGPDNFAADKGGSGVKNVSVNVFGVNNPQQFVQSRMAINRAMRYA